MLTVLRCGRVPISKLQAATAEVVLPNEIVPLLDEVYRVATHEDRCRRGEICTSSCAYHSCVHFNIIGVADRTSSRYRGVRSIFGQRD